MNRIYNYWTEKEIDYLKNNYRELNIKDLMNNLNRTENSIREKTRKLNLNKQSVWTEEKIEYLKNNYAKSDADLLKLNLSDHSWNAIQIEAFKFGLKGDRLLIDEDFFKTWTPEMAYIFGLWIADGNMYEKYKSFSFVSKDYDLINLIKSKLKSEHKVSRCNNAFQLNIHNKIIYNDLLKLGGVPAKSLVIQFPNVPYEYLSHFIRGEFDGDGSFFIHIDKRRTSNYKYLGSNFTGNIDFLTILKKKIKENIDIDPTGFCIADRKNSNRRIYHLTYSNKKALSLGNYIYQDSENLRLERKFEIYEQMKNEYLKKLIKNK